MSSATAFELHHESSGQVAGVATGRVTRNDDPEDLARVRLNLPWRGDAYETDWVRIVSPMSGNERGLIFIPEVGDEVLVAFDRDDISFPYVLGNLWSRTDKPPANNSSQKNDVRMLKTRKGHLLKFDDGSKGLIQIQLNDGKKIEIDDDGIRIDDSSNKITLDAKGGSITIEAAKSLSFKAPTISIEASAKLELKGGAMLDASANMIKLN
jgi:uncharacterized protein involved in type VI secretion and phage assembly